MSKDKIIGFAPIYNEIDVIEGWYNNIKLFCDEIWAIYDPRSNDGTTEYLKKLDKIRKGKFTRYSSIKEFEQKLGL